MWCYSECNTECDVFCFSVCTWLMTLSNSGDCDGRRRCVNCSFWVTSIATLFPFLFISSLDPVESWWSTESLLRLASLPPPPPPPSSLSESAEASLENGWCDSSGEGASTVLCAAVLLAFLSFSLWMWRSVGNGVLWGDRQWYVVMVTVVVVMVTLVVVMVTVVSSDGDIGSSDGDSGM